MAIVINMEKCRLCIDNDATKTNSHIIPWGLVKEAVNQPGHSQRGYDVTFGISSQNAHSLYVGRNVLPNHIEKVTKQDVYENLINKEGDPFSRDYIFCPNCEKKLGVLEDEFIREVYSNIFKHKSKKVDEKGNRFCELDEYDTKLLTLIVYSIFFRISITRFNNYPLKPKIESALRKILIDILDNDIHSFREKIKSSLVNFVEYPFVVYFFDTTPEDKDENLIIQNHSRIPYFIWINNLVFQLFEKRSHVKSSNEYFYGISTIANKNEYLIDNVFGENKICIIADSKRKSIVSSALHSMAETNMNHIKGMFTLVCKKLLNRYPSEYEKNVFGYHYSIISTEKLQNSLKEAFIKSFVKTYNIKE